eukprot:TRINITY_DN8120_c0_g1_i1.p1 TRINITY_DN8120_c0_g1~~TRINITY_DN8120_c0_g1_i1.p1  ORF type:complete len:126 (+),score=31.32 TRINITY_DN8120_c0_g1_i1:258-635(+)
MFIGRHFKYSQATDVSDSKLTVKYLSGTASEAQVQKVVAALASTKADDIEGTMAKALKFFDHDGGDMVTVSELSHVLGSLGEKMDKSEIDEIFRQADVDGFGQINIEEFAKVMRREAGEESNAFA